MALLVSDVVNSARGTLIDAAKVTWPDAELITYTNEALKKTAFARPEIYTQFVDMSLSAGIKQGFDTDTTALFDIFKNTVSGNGITQVDFALLMAANPGWAAMAQVDDIEHFCVDPKSPRTFYVYPPAKAGNTITGLKGLVPPVVSALSDALVVIDAYVPVLIDYVLHRAYSKNSKKQDLTKASFHLQQWAAALGLRGQIQATDTPAIADGTAT